MDTSTASTAVACACAGHRGRFGVQSYTEALAAATLVRDQTGAHARPVQGPDGWTVEVEPAELVGFGLLS